MALHTKHEDFNLLCPECGESEVLDELTDSLGEFYHVCANEKCHQEWYSDVIYTNDKFNLIPVGLRVIAESNLKDHGPPQ